MNHVVRARVRAVEESLRSLAMQDVVRHGHGHWYLTGTRLTALKRESSSKGCLQYGGQVQEGEDEGRGERSVRRRGGDAGMRDGWAVGGTNPETVCGRGDGWELVGGSDERACIGFVCGHSGGDCLCGGSGAALAQVFRVGEEMELRVGERQTFTLGVAGASVEIDRWVMENESTLVLSREACAAEGAAEGRCGWRIEADLAWFGEGARVVGYGRDGVEGEAGQNGLEH